jgi:hypothetical protein
VLSRTSADEREGIEDETPMMYSSTDLLNWKNLGRQASSVTGLWRPKLATPAGDGSFWVRH